MTHGKVAPHPTTLNNLCISQEIQSQNSMENQSQVPGKISKKKLNVMVFSLNVSWMMIQTFQILYHIYAPLSQGPSRGYLAASIFAYSILIAVPTLCYLTTLKEFFRQAFLLDNLFVAILVAIVAFINLMYLFDSGWIWYFKVIQVTFIFQIFLYATTIKIMLASMKWSKWQVIIFKLHLMVNALMFLISGIYYIYVDFTYTMHMLRDFDQRAHDFMVMFVFAKFSCLYEFFSKITDLDYTGILKYDYVIKNAQKNIGEKKRKSALEKESFSKTMHPLPTKVQVTQITDQSSFDTIKLKPKTHNILRTSKQK